MLSATNWHQLELFMSLLSGVMAKTMLFDLLVTLAFDHQNPISCMMGKNTGLMKNMIKIHPILHLTVSFMYKVCVLFFSMVFLTWACHSLFTFCCPGPERAAVIDDVVESQGDDEEGTVAGRVHLERHVALVQSHRLALLRQGCLKQLPRHLGAKMESVNVAKRLQEASCNRKALRFKFVPGTADIFVRSHVSLSMALTDVLRR